MKPLRITILLIFGVFVFSVAVRAQDDEPPASRSITSLDFQAKRKQGIDASISLQTPKNATRKKAIAVVSNPKRRYNLVKRVPAKRTKPVPKAAKPKFRIEELGVTFWRLRPVTGDDEGAPLFPVKIDKERTEDWTAERVASTAEFKKGDRVRFTFEASRTGFLYIVNREFYTDGTSGAANLIFPTLRIRGGDNRVEAGSLIEIPASSDAVPYLTVTPRRADYAGEELLVMILPNELPDFNIGLRAQPVSVPKIAKWLEDWSATADIYDAEDGLGTAYTKAESLAANVSSRALTQEEPLPQTIYKVLIRENAPLMVSIKMNAETYR